MRAGTIGGVNALDISNLLSEMAAQRLIFHKLRKPGPERRISPMTAWVATMPLEALHVRPRAVLWVNVVFGD